MRIPLKFDSEKSFVLLRANFFTQDKLRPIHFLIDTGSSKSTLSSWHAKSIGLDAHNLKEHAEPSLTYAGYVRPLRLRDVGLLLMEESGRLVFEQLKSIDVILPMNEEELDESLPSVIGMDFLNECSYSLYVCPKRNEAFLEKC
ncbi:MAG: retropepsin-like domain-containing protein [Thermoplasmata archaeon]|nr:retropepsin-like domain-containing protein [Thermoplasmata archaeon]